MIRLFTLVSVCLCGMVHAAEDDYLRLPLDEYMSRMTAGWIGQMAGVGWAAPTEFQFNGRIMPESEMPEWKPEMINQFWQDDLYVEMTFLKTLEDYGWEVSHKQAGIDFARSLYPLWHANRTGRDNLRKGIAPPDSGHPQFNSHADDIDYQIQADYSGLIAPGLPNVVIALGEIFGRLTNYGDGLYGGQFVGAMYAAAFFESDMEKLVLAGLEAIPAGSQYAECIRDVLDWWKANPTDWEATWALVEAKYNENPDYRRGSCGGGRKDFNIDAKINGAYIVIGLLYGERDPDKTIIISTRCGQDSDCNPSSAAGILFTSLGMENLPDKFTSELKRDIEFSHTEYCFDRLLEVCEKLAREAVQRAGGRVSVDDNGKESFLIPRTTPQPSPLEQVWEPGPIANSRYTQQEIEERIQPQNLPDGRPDMDRLVSIFADGWMIKDCGLEMDPGLRDEYRGRQNVLVTHPECPTTPCVIWREGTIPANTQGTLRVTVSHYELGDWQFVAKINGEEVISIPVSAETVTDGWLAVDIDLEPYAGQTIRVELLNQATGWFHEAAYWGEITLSGV